MCNLLKSSRVQPLHPITYILSADIISFTTRYNYASIPYPSYLTYLSIFTDRLGAADENCHIPATHDR